MSKKKTKEKKLIEQQRLNKKKMLKELRKEIESLESLVKNANAVNRKRKIVKNLKISVRFMQLLAPYILTAGILAGGCKLIGAGFPFYSGDKFKSNLNTMKEFDNLDNIRYEKQYDDFEESNDILSYHSKWEKDDAGFYSRKIEVYNLKKLTEEEIFELFNKDDLNLQDIFGEPISSKTEIKNNVSEEELNDEAYLQAVMYSIDKNDYIMVKETLETNIGVTFLYILVTALTELGVCIIRVQVTDFSFSYHVKKIKSQYKDIDEKELIKKLEIKRNNYNRLTR